MKITLIIQSIISLLLILAILLQAKGTGLGVAFGQIGDSYHSKRGMEKFLFFLTIILSALFLLFSIINAFF